MTTLKNENMHSDIDGVSITDGLKGHYSNEVRLALLEQDIKYIKSTLDRLENKINRSLK